MKVTGIIAEYNPFHKGHLYQINYIKKKLNSDYVIVALSGDYVQRGTPALFSKHLRAEMALRCGADLVLELPVSVSTSSAEAFAMGGVSMLDGLHVVDQLCFGSEAGEISALWELAEILAKEPEAYQTLLKTFLKQGMSFPAARAQALTEYFKNPHNFKGDDFDRVLTPLLNQILQTLNSPNNILGVEYCKALLKIQSAIKPVTLKRQGMGYHDRLTDIPDNTDSPLFASASGIRGLLNSVPAPTALAQAARQVPDKISDLFLTALENREFLTEDCLDSILVYCILKENASGFSHYLDVSGELSERIRNRANEIHGFVQASSLLKTKEVTQTRVQRALLHIILGIHAVPEQIPYARILGFRRESATLLKEIKKKSSIPLITKLADAHQILDESALQLLEETTFASNLYEKLLCLKSGRNFRHEYQKNIVIL